MEEKEKSKKKYKILRIVILIITILLLIGLTIYLFPMIGKLFDEQEREIFKEEIQSTGIKGILMLLGLQGVQILLPIIPGEPIEILAGMCFGPAGGLIFLMISSCLITALIFFTVRKLGRNFVYGVCSEEKIKKLENSKLFKNSKKIEYIMLILFLIPGRIPSMISSTMAGASIVEGNLKLGIILYAITFLIVGIVIFIAQKRDKTKLTKEIIDNVRK